VTEAFQGTYRGRSVLVTGHTGFKGSWLSLWLRHLGAQVVGVSLGPPSEPNHFAICAIAHEVEDRRADIRDFDAFAAILSRCRPEIVFHLAAQSIVRRAFIDPRETFEVNVMGTVNVLEAARRCPSVRAVVVATSDKCYRNVGWDWGYRETDPLGGHEPYAGSRHAPNSLLKSTGSSGFRDMRSRQAPSRWPQRGPATLSAAAIGASIG
jgi:CDP-glucose 4,6-dehydratase